MRALARRGDLRRCAKGVMLIQEGDVGDTLYGVLDGRLRDLQQGGYVAVEQGRITWLKEMPPRW